MKKGIIRPLVICIFRNEDSILTAEGYDSVKDEYFYRPIGGGIHFGERSSDALKREVKEELNAEIFNIEYLGTLESIFSFNGEVGHELVQVYDATFVDKKFYKDELLINENNGVTYKATWKPLSEFMNNKLRLVPENLLDLLKELYVMK